MAECMSSKARISEEVSTGRSQMLSTGDVRDWDAVVDQVPRCCFEAGTGEQSLLVCTALAQSSRSGCLDRHHGIYCLLHHQYYIS